MKQANIQSLLAELQTEYLANFPAKVAALQSLVANKKWGLLETEFHKLKGTGKTYGLPEFSTIGEAAEKACHANLNPQDPLTQTLFSSVLDLLMEAHFARAQNEQLQIESHPTFLKLQAVSLKAA